MSALQIGANKGIRSRNRAVYVAFSCKMHNGVCFMRIHHLCHEVGIADIALDKMDASVPLQRLETPSVTGISQRIEHH